ALPDALPIYNRLERTALGAVCRVHLEAGAQVMVSAGVLDGREDRPLYEEAFGCPLTLVRLTAPREVVRSRLRRRHEGDPESLACHLDRVDEHTGILDAAAVEGASVPCQDDPPATARAVRAAVRPWGGPTPERRSASAVGRLRPGQQDGREVVLP